MSEDDELTMDELMEGLRDIMKAMPPEWGHIGRLAVLFGYCYHASGLNMEDAERAFRRLKGATDWTKAHQPRDGEQVH